MVWVKLESGNSKILDVTYPLHRDWQSELK